MSYHVRLTDRLGETFILADKYDIEQVVGEVEDGARGFLTFEMYNGEDLYIRGSGVHSIILVKVETRLMGGGSIGTKAIQGNSRTVAIVPPQIQEVAK